VPKKMKKRQKIVTDRLFQLQLARRIAGVSLLGILTLTLFFFIMAQDIVSTLVIKYNIVLDDPSKVFFLEHLPFSLAYFVIIGVIVALQSMIIIRLTHRLAGPVMRFKNVVRNMQQGNLDVDIKLRPMDHGTDLADEINQLGKIYSEQIHAIHEDINRLGDDLQNIKQQSGADESESLRELDTKLTEIEKKLHFFKVADN